MEDRIVKSRVGGMPVRFPTAIGQIELDRSANRFSIVQPNDCIAEIRSGLAIPGAELNDLNVVAGHGTKISAEIAGKPARLQFQFARGSAGREESALMNTRGISELGITAGQLHLGRRRLWKKQAWLGDQNKHQGAAASRPPNQNDGGL